MNGYGGALSLVVELAGRMMCALDRMYKHISSTCCGRASLVHRTVWMSLYPSPVKRTATSRSMNSRLSQDLTYLFKGSIDAKEFHRPSSICSM